MKLPYVHWFRGFAMTHIVLWHSLCTGIVYDSVIEKIIRSLLVNGTTFFVFISGFLFAYLSDRFEYKNFLLKKFNYVVVPYLLVSIPALIWRFSQFSAGTLPADYVPESVMHNPALFFIWTMVTGFHFGPLWFIPYVVLIFLLSPLFYRIAKGEGILPVVLLSLLVTVFTFRPLHNIQPLFSLLHFAGFYILGIFVCRCREHLFWSWRTGLYLLVGVLALLVALECVFDQSQYTFENTVLAGHIALNLNALQKVFFCLLMICLLKQTGSTMPDGVKKYLSLVADYSFGIFFVHHYFIMMLQKSFFTLIPVPSVFATLSVSVMQFMICMSASILIVYLCRQLLNKHSRLVLGA